MSKTTDSFIKTNQEYVKARTHQAGEQEAAYREQPARQAPGGAGHERPEYASWTDEELLAHARGLRLIGPDETLERNPLIELIERAQHPREG